MQMKVRKSDPRSDQYFENGNNGHCGWDLWICNDGNGKCADARVVDQCPSCSYGSLDLSEGLFGHLTDNVRQLSSSTCYTLLTM